MAGWGWVQTANKGHILSIYQNDWKTFESKQPPFPSPGRFGGLGVRLAGDAASLDIDHHTPSLDRHLHGSGCCDGKPHLLSSTAASSEIQNHQTGAP
jgi:hypothetical protein